MLTELPAAARLIELAQTMQGRQIIAELQGMEVPAQQKIELAEALLQEALQLPDRSIGGEDRSRYRQLIAKLYFEEGDIEHALEILDQDLLDPALTDQQRRLTQRKLRLLDPADEVNKEGSFWKDENDQLHRTRGPAAERADGSVEYYIHGKLHRVNGPARRRADGHKAWYQNGRLHRDNGPAIERPDGSAEWYQNGKRHRDDGPARERISGSKEWYQDGLRHRDGGPAIEHPDGIKEWYQDGLRHRDDGPAIEWADGAKEWYQDDQLHREDGPAIEKANGYQEWYLNGQRQQSASE